MQDIGASIERDELFVTQDNEAIWQKYCGFLDLSLDDFMTIQKLLLKEQLALVTDSELGRKITGGKKLSNASEFRQVVPLTTYDDYQPYLGQRTEGVLARKPAIWARTSGKTGFVKWMPYNDDALNRLADDTVTAFILSAAARRGDVQLHEGVRVVLSLPPMPYTTAIMARVAGQRVVYQAIPPLDQAETMSFEERIRLGYQMALYTGIDYVSSISVVLAKVGESFGQLGRSTKFSLPSWHPLAVLRLLKALVKSKCMNRPMLPRDIWRVKGLVCGGTDTAIYRDQINYYWGVQPLDVYVSTETGFVAMQSWNKKGMTFVPYSNFYEFIPEEEWLRNRENKEYQPSTVLMDEVEEGKTYEVVITNFRGGPLLRYRLGDLITITALRDNETGINLPQMTFVSRSDDIIDIAGFVRLDEKTVWQAIQDTGIPYIDWCARKEDREGKSVLHIYLESPRDNLAQQEVARLIDQRLVALDNDYRDFRSMIGADSLVVTLLNQGTFQRYMAMKQAAGFDLAHWKPPHMSAGDAVITDLLSASQQD